MPTQLTSAAAALNAVMLALRQRWAIWTNIAVGSWSLIIVWIVHGHLASYVIIAVACAVSTGLAIILLRPQAPAALAH